MVTYGRFQQLSPEHRQSIVASAIITGNSNKRTTERQQNGNSSINNPFVHIAYAEYRTILTIRKMSL
jgi:hypothetical protein